MLVFPALCESEFSLQYLFFSFVLLKSKLNRSEIHNCTIRAHEEGNKNFSYLEKSHCSKRKSEIFKPETIITHIWVTLLLYIIVVSWGWRPGTLISDPALV